MSNIWNNRLAPFWCPKRNNCLRPPAIIRGSTVNFPKLLKKCLSLGTGIVFRAFHNTELTLFNFQSASYTVSDSSPTTPRQVDRDITHRYIPEIILLLTCALSLFTNNNAHDSYFPGHFFLNSKLGSHYSSNVVADIFLSWSQTSSGYAAQFAWPVYWHTST